jgi:hypothetical protein
MWKQLSEPPLKEKIIQVIEEIDLKLAEIEQIEDCEMITNLIIGQVLEMINDSKMKKDILQLQREHAKPNKQRWTKIVENTMKLWEKAGGGDRILKYHSIEQPCREISIKEINSLENPKHREIILKIRHIHDNPLERLTRIASTSYSE